MIPTMLLFKSARIILATEGMTTYIKFPPKRDPSHVIIQVGTNNIRSSQDIDIIAKSIIDIAKNSKND